jgi:putative ABC transport system permease protein
MNFLALAYKNIFRNRRRSITTILVSAIGCAGLLISTGFALYTYSMLADNAVRESGHITIADKRFFDNEEETPLQFGITNPANIINTLNQNNHIEFVLPRLFFSGLISNDDKSVIFSGIGANVNSEVNVRGEFLKTIEGNLQLNHSTAPSVVLGKDLARSLNAKVGSALTLMATTTEGTMNAIDVVVSAIITTGWNEADKRMILVDISNAQKLLKTDKVSTLSVYLFDPNKIIGIQKEISVLSDALITKPWSEQAFYYSSVKALYNRIFGLLGIIIALLVVFSVSNTLSTAVAERTREIGTLRAIGSYPREIIAQFVNEGFLIGICGVLMGNLFAFTIEMILPSLGLQMPPPPGRSVGYPLLVDISFLLYIIADMIIVLLCCFAAFFASQKASRMHIMEALRHV